MTEPRSSDQILVDALVAEKARLSRRLEKLKAIQAADPLGELMELHKKAAGMDFNDPSSRKELLELAARERQLFIDIDRKGKRDTFKDISEQTILEIEIGNIDIQISFKKMSGRCK